ncbi:sodium-independent sulfate anion transporter isoform X3 [Apus apus]|uniref:sodium-independent sulfate anion transporter isoform X3 n=1 Tax=Apus apus TaxID=8895 RepID=UPI0021F89AF8|nr:sodium-independent sulfate anion transporter isoform X3 [Apus apus]
MPGPRQCCPCPGGWRWLPALRWLPRYSLAWLQLDLMAGLTVGLTVVPQALAYAEVAGLPLQYGLYSSFTGCFVYCFLGTAKDVTLGPTAIMSLLVSSYAFHEPVYAVLLAFLSGCIQLAMGLLHLGFLLDFISCPVIKGFTSAASITISFNQVKNILGLQGIPRQFFLQVYETLRRIGETRAGDAVLGLACLAALAGLQAMKSRLPRAAGAEPLAARVSYLIVWTTATARNALVVLFAGLVAYSFQVMGSQPLTLTGSIPRGLPAFRLPRFSMAAPNGTVPFRSMVEGDLCPLVVTLTVSFPPRTWGSGWPWSRSWACWRPLRLPRLLPLRTVTGLTPTRSCWLWDSRERAVGCLHPRRRVGHRAALAAVIISAVVPMFDAEIFRTLWRVKRLDLVPLCVTFLLCFWEVQYGIVAGVLVSGILLLYSIARPPIKVLEGDVLVVQPGSSLHFPAVECLRDAICSRALAAPSPPRSIILDCHHISSIDYTAVVGLAELLQELHNHSLSLAFCSVQDTVLQVLLSADLEGFQHFPSLEEAERAAGAESEGGRAAPFTSTSQSSLLPTGLIQ